MFIIWFESNFQNLQNFHPNFAVYLAVFCCREEMSLGMRLEAQSLVLRFSLHGLWSVLNVSGKLCHDPRWSSGLQLASRLTVVGVLYRQVCSQNTQSPPLFSILKVSVLSWVAHCSATEVSMNQWPLSQATLFTSWSWLDIEFWEICWVSDYCSSVRTIFCPRYHCLTTHKSATILLANGKKSRSRLCLVWKERVQRFVFVINEYMKYKSSCQKSKTATWATHCNSNLGKIRVKSKVHVHKILCWTRTLFQWKANNWKVCS